MNFADLCANLCANEIRIAQMLRDGVAFYNPPRRLFSQKAYYSIFSHEGDHLGDLTVFEVESMVKKVRALGSKSGWPENSRIILRGRSPGKVRCGRR